MEFPFENATRETESYSKKAAAFCYVFFEADRTLKGNKSAIDMTTGYFERYLKDIRGDIS
jgi:hypothetical protein